MFETNSGAMGLRYLQNPDILLGVVVYCKER